MGSAEAMWRIGIMHENGEHFDASDTEAVEWYRRSAEGGSTTGMTYLPTCCAMAMA